MGTMLKLNLDEILVKLSFALPLGLGRTHARALSSKLDRSAQSCLDVGCGEGSFKVIQDFYSVGCDIYHSFLIKAREKGYYDNLVRCDVRQLPFKPKSFDIAICVEVIEHLDKAGGIEGLPILLFPLSSGFGNSPNLSSICSYAATLSPDTPVPGETYPGLRSYEGALLKPSQRSRSRPVISSQYPKPLPDYLPQAG
jgi:SAM-dependent methyltransferase